MVKKIQKKLQVRGFTIIELIIVVTVIGILAGIVLVSYTGTRNQADKSAYSATAQQVKLKLGEYLTSNNHYPQTKSGTGSVEEYLTATNAISLRDDFSKPDYSYSAYTDSSKVAVCSSGTDCQYYEIIVTKNHWSGDSTDSDIVIKP